MNYSSFWREGGRLTDPAWAARDALSHSAETLSMAAWNALSEAERCAVVQSYAARHPEPLMTGVERAAARARGELPALPPVEREPGQRGRPPRNVARNAAIVAAFEAGESGQAIGERFGMDRARVYGIVSEWRKRVRR